jgi:Uri superfamily endonuclease
MAFTIHPGMTQDWYPFDRRVLGGALERIDIYQVGGEDSVREIWCGGHVWFKERTGSKTVVGVGFIGAATNLDIGEVNNLRVSIHALSHNGFGPDAVEIDSQIIATYDEESYGWKEVGSMNFEVSFGQELCVAFSQQGGQLSSDRLGVYAFQDVADGCGRAFPWVATWGTDINGTIETRITGMLPALVLEFDDGTFGMLDGSVPALSYGTAGFDEELHGLQFRLPWDCEIDALSMYGGIVGLEETDTVSLVLWEGTTSLAEAEVDEAEVRATTSSRLIEIPLNEKIALSKDTDYIVGVRPNNGATAAPRFLLLADAGHRDLFGTLHLGSVNRDTSADPWSALDTTTLYRFGVRLCSAPAADPVLVGAFGVYTYTGFDTTLTRLRRIQADSGSYTTTGTAANLAQTTKRLDAEYDLDHNHYFYSGFTALTLYGRRFNAEYDLDHNHYFYSGFTAVFRRGLRLEAVQDVDFNHYFYTGFTAVLSRNYILRADAGAYGTDGVAATLTYLTVATYELDVDAGSYTTTGSTTTVTATREVDVENGFYFYLGSDAAFFNGYRLAADTGSYSVTGSTATVTATRRDSFENGSYAYIGSVTLLVHTFLTTADSSSYTTTGFAATTTATRRLSAESGSYATAGAVAALTQGVNSTSTCRRSSGIFMGSAWRGRLPTPDGSIVVNDRRHVAYYYCGDMGARIDADAGSYDTTGFTTTFVRGYLVDAENGFYAYLGSTTELCYGHFLTAALGEYAVTGSTATPTATRRITAETTVYVVTGSETTLIRGRAVEAATGVYTVTGGTPDILAARRLTAESGSYVLTGSAATLTYFFSGFNLSGESGGYNVTGSTVDFLYGRIMTAESASYALTGIDTDPFVFEASWIAGQTILVDEIMEQ